MEIISACHLAHYIRRLLHHDVRSMTCSCYNTALHGMAWHGGEEVGSKRRRRETGPDQFKLHAALRPRVQTNQ